jgi:hypothetical protein
MMSFYRHKITVKHLQIVSTTELLQWNMTGRITHSQASRWIPSTARLRIILLPALKTDLCQIK